MIDRLKAHYGEHAVLSPVPRDEHNIAWFQIESSNYIGIDKNVLSTKDLELLSIFLTPYEPEHVRLTPEKAYWYNLLFQHPAEILQEERDVYIRFIHFSIARPIQDKHEFEEALKGLYHSNVVILWENNQDGVIIEKFSHTILPDYNLDAVIDVLVSDFGANMHFFEGQAHHLPMKPGHQFHLEKQWFKLCKPVLHHQRTIRLVNAFASLLLSYTPDPLKEELRHTLHEVIQDKELLKTIKTYLECNLNVSLTSKKLYMHRNSLQYRIDKFIEKTGIDIKNFQGAVTAYLAILAKEE
ncbi:MAG TPA: helix-turn-helix domain-containing protein [Bacillus sp. (in: firmicutes)]|nr:helix-turn-helix domain-containing protein [Bacillus sp. (in: firmicutes)]